ncbi:hypothetical protein STPH2_1447 [Streptomyces sp. KO7888]|nr:hypothetical protein [Streptomyces sp. KO7888]
MSGEQLLDTVAAGLLPAADGMRYVDEVDGGTVRREQAGHQRFHAEVGDHGDRMAEGGAGQGQTQAEGARGGLHDPRPGEQGTAFSGRSHHVKSGSVLDAAGIVTFELGPEAASSSGERLTDPQNGRVTNEPGGGVHRAFGDSQQLGRASGKGSWSEGFHGVLLLSPAL